MSFGLPLNLSFPLTSGLLIGNLNANRGADENRCRREKPFRPSFMFCAPAANGKHCQRNMGALAPFTNIFRTGIKPGYS